MKSLEYKIKEPLNSIDNLITGKYSRGKSFDQRYSQISSQIDFLYSNKKESKYLNSDQIEQIGNQIVEIKQRQQTYLGQKTKYNKDLSDKVELVIKKLQTIRNEHYSIGNKPYNENEKYFSELEQITRGKVKGSRTFDKRLDLLEEKLNKYDKNKVNLNDIDEFKNVLATLDKNKYLNAKIMFINKLEEKGELKQYENSLSEQEKKRFQKNLRIVKQKQKITERIKLHEKNIYSMIKPLQFSTKLKKQKTLEEVMNEIKKPTPIKAHIFEEQKYKPTKEIKEIKINKLVYFEEITYDTINKRNEKEENMIYSFLKKLYQKTVKPVVASLASIL